MRSKIFYSKFAKTSFMKQLWIMGMTAFAYFIFMLVPLVIDLNNWTGDHYTLENIRHNYTSYMVQSDASYVLIILLGSLVAICQFAYLHSGRQQDFYGSLSIRKEKMYLQKAVFSYIDFVIPYTVITLICTILGMVRGLMTPYLLIYILETWIVNQVGFILVFMVATLAMLLTGRIWVAAFGTVVLLGGGYYIQSLINGLMSEWFDTYFLGWKTEYFSYLSPVYLIYRIRVKIYDLLDFGQSISGGFVGFLLLLIIICVALFFLNQYIIKTRPSEKAGHSMAFAIPARVLHIFMSIALGLGIGYLSMSFVYANDIPWFFMGSVFGTACMYVLIQFIYTLDIKKTFAYKWQIIFAELAVLAVCAVFSFDLFGYDKYLPGQERIESVAIRYEDYNLHANFYENDRYVDSNKYTMDRMFLEPDDRTYAFLDTIVNKKYTREDHEDIRNVYVYYRLENGLKKTRVYQVPIEKFEEDFVHLFGQEDFLQAIYPTFLVDKLFVRNIRLYYAGREVYLYDLMEEADTGGDVSAEEAAAKRFLEGYNRDISSLDAATFVEEIPVAKVTFSLDDEGRITTITLPVYEQCKETMSNMKSLGHEPVQAVNAEHVDKIVIEDYSWDYIAESGEITVEEELLYEKGQYPTYTITDQEDISRILEASADDTYNSPWVELEQGYYIRVYMKDYEYGTQVSYNAMFLKGQVPADILEAQN